jgi:hypothetical protein
VEAHALDEEGAVPAVIREVARIYPLEKFEVVSDSGAGRKLGQGCVGD